MKISVIFVENKVINEKLKMIKELIRTYGKDKINTLTKYPSILTLHKLGEKGRLLNELTTLVENEEMYATEKIDGTNARIICYGSEFLIGAREFILHHSDDLYFDNSQEIVNGIYTLGVNIPITNNLTVIYGEFYGGKTSANSKQYGKELNGFRVFDIAVYDDLSVLDKNLADISKWRETETKEGIVYGQNFLTRSEMTSLFPEFEYVPLVDFNLGAFSHKEVLINLTESIPTTNVALTETALKKPEGLVLRNWNRSKIVKVRYEDYERILKFK